METGERYPARVMGKFDTYIKVLNLDSELVKIPYTDLNPGTLKQSEKQIEK